MPRWSWLALVAILLFSAWVHWTNARETRFYTAGGPDAMTYVSYAYNLRESGIYSRVRTWDPSVATPPIADAVSPPGYPLFLIPFLRGGPDYGFLQRVISAQAILGILTTLFVFLFGARMAGPSLACAASLLTAISPHLVTIDTSILTESLFTCLLFASLYAFACALQGGSRMCWAIAGLVFGGCCLVRPTLQALPILTPLMLVAFPHGRPFLKKAAISIVVCVALLSPWMAYKQSLPVRPDQPNLLRATLYHGSFPGMMYADDPRTFGFGYRFDPHAAEIMSSDAGLVKWVGARMRAQPVKYLAWYLVGKPRFFLSWNNSAAGAGDIFTDELADSPYFHRVSFRAMRALMFALHWPLMLLGVFAAFAALLRPAWFPATIEAKPLRMLAWLVLLAIAFHMIGAPYPRYGIPFRPLFYLLALAALAGLAHLFRSRGQS